MAKGRMVSVRLQPELLRALQADADAHGRTIAASTRLYLERALLVDEPRRRRFGRRRYRQEAQHVQ